MVRARCPHLDIREGNVTQRIFRASGACVVNQYVELAKGVHGARDNIATHLRIGTVAHNRGDVLGVKAFFRKLLDKGIQLALVAAGHGDLGAFPE